MNLKENIQADKLAAFKSGNKTTNMILGVLIGELEQKGKTSTDEEVVREIKKMIENAKLCGTTEEGEVLNKYLPVMMTEEEIDNVLITYLKSENITSKKDVGKIMSYCKQQFGSSMDMKITNKILAKYLV